MLKAFKRSILLLLLAVSIFFGTIIGIANNSSNTYTTYAEPDNLLTSAEDNPEQAGSLVQDAIEALFANEEGVVEIANIFSSIFSGVGMVNSGITFLKLTGIMKDATAESLANIQRQLTAITDRLAIMDAKLDTIIKKMEEIRAEQDFIKRTDAARDYREYYRNFRRDYVTNTGLIPLITQFEAMQLNSTRTWYEATNATERQGNIDNSQIVVIYDLINTDTTPKYDLRFTTTNGIPADADARYVVFNADFLPTIDDVAAWNVDNYRTEIINYVKNKINTIPDQLQTSANFPELTEAMINQITEDLVNVIVFRTTATAINRDAQYPLSVINAFNNYAENLNLSEVGFDACIKSLYYTHAFEYEIAETIEELCASFIIETAYYGSFVKDVLEMSKDINAEKKATFNSTYCKAINKLEKTKERSLTGKPNYCYLTNTVLYYGEVDVNASGKIQYYKKGGTTGYMASSGKGFDIQIKRFDETSKLVGTYGLNQMIGNHAATLISMTLLSNGILADHAYFAKQLSGATNAKDCGVILADMTNEKDLAFDSTYPLKVKKVIGDYFTDGSNVSMRYLPNKTTTDYITWHKALEGSVYNPANGALEVNSTVAAIAIYGESHWFWNTDESAFMSGTPSNVVTRNYNTRNTTHKDAEKQIYIMDFDFATAFNCLLQEALAPSLMDNSEGADPLYDFRQANNYKDPAPAEEIPAATEVEFVVKEDLQEEKDRAILLLPKIYAAIIIIPCVIFGIATTCLVVFLVLRYRKNKKNTKINE